MPESKDPEDANASMPLKSIFTRATVHRRASPGFLVHFAKAAVPPISEFSVGRAMLGALILCQLATAQSSPPAKAAPQVTVTVTDENNAAVIGARVLRNDMERSRVFQAETDFRGRARFPAASGPHRFLVEKPGFYSALLPELKPSQSADVQVKLRH